ncbi:MAG: hypothetical protein ACXWJS_04065, partial [Hyphomicrobium sp.]|jgi:hypothetical protein
MGRMGMGRTAVGLILSALLMQAVATAVLAQDAPAQPSTPKRPADRDQALPKEPEPPVWAPPDLATPGPAAPATPDGAAKECAKADFEAVVDDAAAALRDLNLKNKPDFQEKLRQLKDKRGWSHDQFMTEAAPYVRDDKIAVFDQESEQLLNDISSLGQEGADAKTPDCALLHELRARMKVLVDTQQAKWTYMFEKLNAALAQ